MKIIVLPIFPLWGKRQIHCLSYLWALISKHNRYKGSRFKWIVHLKSFAVPIIQWSGEQWIQGLSIGWPVLLKSNADLSMLSGLSVIWSHQENMSQEAIYYTAGTHCPNQSPANTSFFINSSLELPLFTFLLPFILWPSYFPSFFFL